MLFKTIQANALKSCFEVLKDIINDVNMFFDAEGMKIVALDNAKVALINMKLQGDKFEEYSCPEPIKAGVNVSNLFKLLKFITSNDILTIEINNTEHMEIIIENDIKHTVTKFKLSLLWINDDELQLPEIDTTCTTILPSIDFQRICRDMGNLASDIYIYRKKNILEISCKGDFANQETQLDTEQNDFGGVIGNMYSLKYIHLFTKSTGMCSTMKIQQTEPSEKMPIIFVYDVANLGKIEFYLAAKLDE
jgi:proliferating cell nuclear antigen